MNDEWEEVGSWKSRGGDGSSSDGGRARRLMIAVVVLAAAAAAAWFGSRIHHRAWPPPGWLFAACDVGQGDALALAAGPATAVVIDTGPDPAKADACLSDLGIRHIPLLILTHFHADHIAGVPGVLDHRDVAEIETTTDPDPPDGAAKVVGWARAAHIRLTQATVGERREYGPVSWDVLWPDPAQVLSPQDQQGVRPKRRSRGHPARAAPRGGGEEGSGPNNASVVLHVRETTPDGPVTLLLTGDIEPPAQEAILAAHPDLASDVLKIPHHGSAYQDPDLMQAVRPKASIISVGRGNTYGHPAPRTLQLAASGGARVFRTDRDGTVLVVGPAGRLEIVTRR